MATKNLQDVLDKYPERPRITSIPFGYQKKVGDPNLLVPDPVIMPLLDDALDQLDAGNSLRMVAEWINSKLLELDRTDLSMSFAGLLKLRAFYRPNHPKPKKKNNVRKLTPEEKAIQRRKRQLAAEKRVAIARSKRQAKLEQEIEILQSNEEEIKESPTRLEIDYSSPLYQEVLEDERPVVFKPNPGPQEQFFMAGEQEVLYGGAAGGGKSYAMIADPMAYFDNKNFRGLILRRTNDELRELIFKSKLLYKQIWPKANWSDQKKEWTFPSGATLWITYLERDDDVLRYQGQAFTYIGFDELTQYPTSKPWEYMRSRLRDDSKSLPLLMRATTNPGGPGHGWVKRMFIDPAPAGTAFPATNIETGEELRYKYGDSEVPKEKWGQPLFHRKFIPARLSDNPYLNDDGQYRANLLSLRDGLQKQLLDGDWGIADGAAFSEFRQKYHTCEPFPIPSEWRKFRSCDYGYASASAVHWYAVDNENTIYVYRELYTSKKTGKELAHMILNLEKNEKITYGVLDSSVWAMRGQSGPSIAEEMIGAGCRWRPSDRSAGSRTAGKNRLHELLKLRDNIPRGDHKDLPCPGIIFFDTCRQIISDLPIIPVDPDGEDDIDDRYPTDHAYDSIRYGIMSRPRSAYFDDFPTTTSTKSYNPTDSVFGY